MIWSREIEGGSFATPERRAALEARIGEIANGIRDEVVRRYYRQDLAERLQRTFAPEGGARRLWQVAIAMAQRGRTAANQAGALRRAVRSRPGRRPIRAARRPLARSRRQPDHRPRALPGGESAARASPIMRGQRSAMSRREALILQSLINHPWLLHDHLEEVAALELAHPEAHKLRAGIIAAFADDHHHRPSPPSRARSCGPILKELDFHKQFKGLIGRSRPRRCGARKPARRAEDVLSTWHQLVSLHRQCALLT